jgi:ribosomal protein L32
METSVRKSRACNRSAAFVTMQDNCGHTTLRHESCSNSYRGSFATPLTLIHFNATCNLLLLLLFDNYVHVNAYCREITMVRCKTLIPQNNRKGCWQYRFSANYGMIPILLCQSTVQPNFHVVLLTYNISKPSTYVQNILLSHDYMLSTATGVGRVA